MPPKDRDRADAKSPAVGETLGIKAINQGQATSGPTAQGKLPPVLPGDEGQVVRHFPIVTGNRTNRDDCRAAFIYFQ